MFVDTFHGGPLDGQVQPSTVESATDDVLITETGAEYIRDAALDTPGTRAWTHREGPAADVYLPESGPRPVALERPMGLTLRQLEEFAAAARRRGWSDETPVHGLLRFSGRVKRLYVKKR